MDNSNFKWHNKSELYGLDGTFYNNKLPASWFTVASIFHFLFGLYTFIFFKTILNANSMLLVFFINFVHVIEDYLENNSTFSLEALYAKIIKCKNVLYISNNDHDSLQNFIGDNISCFVGTILGYYLYNNFELIRNLSVVNLLLILVLIGIIHFYMCKMSPYPDKYLNQT